MQSKARRVYILLNMQVIVCGFFMQAVADFQTCFLQGFVLSVQGLRLTGAGSGEECGDSFAQPED